MPIRILRFSPPGQHMGETESRRCPRWRGELRRDTNIMRRTSVVILSLYALLLPDIQFLTGPEGGCVVFDSSDFGSNFVVFFIHSDFFETIFSRLHIHILTISQKFKTSYSQPVFSSDDKLLRKRTYFTVCILPAEVKVENIVF